MTILHRDDRPMKLRIILLIALEFCIPSLHAAVIVHSLPQPLDVHTGDDIFFVDYFPFDVDGNGTIDYTFIANLAEASLRTERANRLVIRVSPPPNLGGPVASLPADYQIGPSLLHSGIRWTSSDLLGGYVSPDELQASGIIQVLFSGSSTQFTERSAIGIEFEAEDGIHYGYFDVSPATFLAPRITLHGWAWETRPGVPILAGRVPEPSTLVFLIVAGGSLLQRRRKG